MTARVIAEFDDLRRFVAGRTSALFRTFLNLEGAIEDLEGAIEQSRLNPVYLDCLPLMGRTMIYGVLSIVGVRSSGAIGRSDDVNGSFQGVFRGVPNDVVEEAMRLLVPPDERTVDAFQRWFDELRAFAARHIELPGETLPEIRTPDGMFAAMAIARDWMMLGVQLSVNPAPFV